MLFYIVAGSAIYGGTIVYAGQNSVVVLYGGHEFIVPVAPDIALTIGD